MNESQVKVLVCATDAGGAANVAPVYAGLAPETRAGIIASSTTKRIFTDYCLNSDIDEREILIESELSQLFGQKNPIVVLCGTKRY